MPCSSQKFKIQFNNFDLIGPWLDDEDMRTKAADNEFESSDSDYNNDEVTLKCYLI